MNIEITPPERIESKLPICFRQVMYPNGEILMQGMYTWREGISSGVTWKELPLVYVDEYGNEH